jgi:hypothetical protein
MEFSWSVVVASDFRTPLSWTNRRGGPDRGSRMFGGVGLLLRPGCEAFPFAEQFGFGKVAPAVYPDSGGR